MSARPRPRKREAQLAFEALSIEGGLLSPSFLARVAQLQATAQAEADYRVPKGLHLRDEIGRYWRVAQAYHADFVAGRKGSADPHLLAERFVVVLLRESFGFATLAAIAPVELGGRTYPIGHAALGGRVPVILAPAGSGIDTLAPMFGEGGRRRSAFGLGQEYLNAAEGALWGIVSDGVTLRVLHDNVSLTRPAWIEADLSRIFAEERYSDFAALWLILHESRFGRADQPVTECALEVWRAAGLEEGISARARLRDGVEEALLAFGQGFLSHPDNQALRAALHGGSLSRTAYFQELLRLVYRLLFLLTAEERGLLHAEDAPEKARSLYANGYGMRRLRERSVKRSAHDRFSDLWESVKIVFRGLAKAEPLLGLPALAGLFAPSQCPTLDASKLENRALLTAVFRISWLREESGLARVNWRDMGPEELGSVYESLLELVPQITQDGRVFTFASGLETKGNARKLTGSYYTPTSLVEVLLDSALEPVLKLAIAKHPENPVEALLGLAVVDPACGSGHFLLAAANRLAGHVARLQANGTPSPQEHRHALRQVVGRCIHGVDLNPMAVELCKLSLWMEAVEPGRPLSFLDSHIQHGNALLGATPELMEKGIPDDAWDPIEGDDRKIASALKKKNKKAAGGQRGLDLFVRTGDSEAGTVARAVGELETAPDGDAAALAQKEEKWRGILVSEAYRHQKLVADAWCAAFVWPKQAGELQEAAPTDDVWRQLRDGQGAPSPLLVKTTEELAEQYRFFHWHLAFSQVFARGGFDVVLGNPPWERVKLQEQEFFAWRDEEIAAAPNAAVRKKLIANLPRTNRPLWAEWCDALRAADGQSNWIRQSQRYPLCGAGDVNTYALFAEHNRAVLKQDGRAGFIVPTGIATDDSTKEYFSSLVQHSELASFLSFENEEFVFSTVHHAFKFALLTVDRSGQSITADLTFFARQVHSLNDPERHFTLTSADFAALNPNTRTCPTFRSRRDANLNLSIYRRAGVLWRDDDRDGNPWGVRFLRMFDMANDSGLFRTRADLEAAGWVRSRNQYEIDIQRALPLFEAKMIQQFDHRFGTYEGQHESQANQGKLPELDNAAHLDPNVVNAPKYWVNESAVDTRLDTRWNNGWLLGWRDICRSTDQRTLIASLIPRSACGDTFLLAMPSVEPRLVAALYGNLCSFALDYAARQKVGGTHLKYHVFKQLPILAPSVYSSATAWSGSRVVRDWILDRVLELTYTAWDLQPFAEDVGYSGPPFRWDPARRFLLRAELDAAFFVLYGISLEDASYILDTFPVVRKNEEKLYGTYRTKTAILECFEALMKSSLSGQPYRTKLDPPPADPRVAHLDRGDDSKAS